MFLQLAGHDPLHNAENPLAPGAKTYSYDAMYLGQSADIILPDALYPANVEGYAAALKSLTDLYNQYFSRRKKTPAEVVASPGMAGVTIAAVLGVVQVVSAAVGALSVVVRQALGSLASQNITTLYNGNNFNVQNLNGMNADMVAAQISQIDTAIASTGRFNFPRSMALARFRLVFQQRFDRLTGTGGFGGLLIPAAIALGAFFLLRRK